MRPAPPTRSCGDVTAKIARRRVPPSRFGAGSIGRERRLQPARSTASDPIFGIAVIDILYKRPLRTRSASSAKRAIVGCRAQRHAEFEACRRLARGLVIERTDPRHPTTTAHCLHSSTRNGQSLAVGSLPEETTTAQRYSRGPSRGPRVSQESGITRGSPEETSSSSHRSVAKTSGRRDRGRNRRATSRGGRNAWRDSLRRAGYRCRSSDDVASAWNAIAPPMAPRTTGIRMPVNNTAERSSG